MSEPNTDDLRTRLQTAMTEGGFTQVDVSKAIGMSQSVISKFLRGATTPPPDTLNRIRAFLGDELHGEVLSHEEVRSAVRLYRFVKGILEDGSQLVIRDKDGTEKIIIPLW